MPAFAPPLRHRGPGSPQAVCNSAVWCITQQNLPHSVLAPLHPYLLRSLLHALSNPMGSSSIVSEACKVRSLSKAPSDRCGQVYRCFTRLTCSARPPGTPGPATVNTATLCCIENVVASLVLSGHPTIGACPERRDEEHQRTVGAPLVAALPVGAPEGSGARRGSAGGSRTRGRHPAPHPGCLKGAHQEPPITWVLQVSAATALCLGYTKGHLPCPACCGVCSTDYAYPLALQAMAEEARGKSFARLESMARSGDPAQNMLPAVHAWAWMVRLLGPCLTEKGNQLVNLLLRIPESAFGCGDNSVRVATQVRVAVQAHTCPAKHQVS